MSSTELTARAKTAYERGRARSAATETLLLVPLVALALSRCTHLSIGCLASVALVVLVATLRWRGGLWGRAAIVGTLAALPALLMPLVMRGCSDCAPEALARACAILCPSIGLFSGALLGSWSARQGADRNRALLGGGLVVAVCGALGCDVVGLAAIGGMWIGATVATLGAMRLTAQH